MPARELCRELYRELTSKRRFPALEPFACPGRAKALASSAFPGPGPFPAARTPPSTVPEGKGLSLPTPWRCSGGKKIPQEHRCLAKRWRKRAPQRPPRPSPATEAAITPRPAPQPPDQPLNCPLGSLTETPSPARPDPTLTRSPRPCPARPGSPQLSSALPCHCHCISPQPARRSRLPAGKRKPLEPLFLPARPPLTTTGPTKRPPQRPQRWEKGSGAASEPRPDPTRGACGRRVTEGTLLGRRLVSTRRAFGAAGPAGEFRAGPPARRSRAGTCGVGGKR